MHIVNGINDLIGKTRNTNVLHIAKVIQPNRYAPAFKIISKAKPNGVGKMGISKRFGSINP